MKTYFIYFLPFLLLASCAQNNTQATADKPTLSNLSNFSHINQDYIEAGSTPAKLILLTSQALRSLQSENNDNHQHVKTSGDNNSLFKTSIWDVQEMNGARDYKDSNYHITNGIFTTTYRPKTLYGSNTRTYTPYCPVFYDSHQKKNIADYLTRTNAVYPMSLNDLARYQALFAYSSCALLNQNYQAQKPQASEREHWVRADKFSILIFMKEKNLDMVNFIINHNDTLHNLHIIHSEELKKFYLNAKNQKLDKLNTYEIWLEVDKLEKK